MYQIITLKFLFENTESNTMNKIFPIKIGIVITIIILGIYLAFLGDWENSSNPVTQSDETKMLDVPEGLKLVTINGKIKPYEVPSGAPQSNIEPKFVIIPDKNYPEVNGAISIALYNLKQYPENPEHVQLIGYYNPKNPDWYYPNQTQRTQQVLFVEKLVQLEPIDLGNKFTTQELRTTYDQIQNELQTQKDQFLANTISEEQYLKNLDELNKAELKLYENVKNHTFARDEMTEYNFWYRGVMKFPTSIEQEISRVTQP